MIYLDIFLLSEQLWHDLKMVRTRNTRNNSGGGGSKDNSPTFKPSSSGAKKGRKRQLTSDGAGQSSGGGHGGMMTPSGHTSSSLSPALMTPAMDHYSNDDNTAQYDNNNMDSGQQVGEGDGVVVGSKRGVVFRCCLVRR